MTAAFNGLKDTASCKHCSARVQMGYHACGGQDEATELHDGGILVDTGAGEYAAGLIAADVVVDDGNGNDIESTPPELDAADGPPGKVPLVEEAEVIGSQPEKWEAVADPQISSRIQCRASVLWIVVRQFGGKWGGVETACDVEIQR